VHERAPHLALRRHDSRGSNVMASDTGFEPGPSLLDPVTTGDLLLSPMNGGGDHEASGAGLAHVVSSEAKGVGVTSGLELVGTTPSVNSPARARVKHWASSRFVKTHTRAASPEGPTLATSLGSSRDLLKLQRGSEKKLGGSASFRGQAGTTAVGGCSNV